MEDQSAHTDPSPDECGGNSDFSSRGTEQATQPSLRSWRKKWGDDLPCTSRGIFAGHHGLPYASAAPHYCGRLARLARLERRGLLKVVQNQVGNKQRKEGKASNEWKREGGLSHGDPTATLNARTIGVGAFYSVLRTEDANASYSLFLAISSSDKRDPFQRCYLASLSRCLILTAKDRAGPAPYILTTEAEPVIRQKGLISSKCRMIGFKLFSIDKIRLGTNWQ